MNKVAVIGVAGNSVFLSVGRFASEGETVEAQSVHFEPGGKGFNQAVAAARYGADVAFLSATGHTRRWRASTAGVKTVRLFLKLFLKRKVFALIHKKSCVLYHKRLLITRNLKIWLIFLKKRVMIYLL